jgi:hypothetical protein
MVAFAPKERTVRKTLNAATYFLALPRAAQSEILRFAPQ